MSATSQRRRVPEGSCHACRKRRLKCDLGRPRCSKCEANSTTCDYSERPLQWVGGAASRGRLKTIGAPTIAENHNKTVSQAVELVQTACSSPPRLSSTLSSPMVPENYFTYFTETLWPRFQLSGQLISLDEDMLVHEAALRDAVLAIAQAHHHLLLKSEDSAMARPGGQTRREARQVALSRFRTRIRSGAESEEEACQLFQIVCMFCVLDGMVYPDDQGDASEQHLRGGVAILRSWSSIPFKMLLAGGLQGHLLSIFATVDLVHSLLDGTGPYIEPTTWSMFAGVQAWWGRLDAGDPFLAILKLYSDLASLGRMVYIHLPSTDGMRLAERCTEPILSTLRAGLPRSAVPDFASPDEWDIFCGLYEASATVYIYRALQNRRVDDENVQQVIRNATATLVDRPLPEMMNHCLVFPMLVIGSHCLRPQDQSILMKRLTSSASYLAFGNSAVMIRLLQNLWAAQDMDSDWWTMYDSISRSVFLF